MARKPAFSRKQAAAMWQQHLTANPGLAEFCEADESEARGDLRGAIRMFKRSADMGCMQATARLGTIYADRMQPARPDLAVLWYKRGVRLGYEIEAQNLAMHYKQLGKTRWYTHWLKRAIELGDEDSRAELEGL